MSAFVVATAHIDTLVSAALAHGVQAHDPASATALGRLLLRENVASVVERYRLAAGEEARGYADLVEGYRYSPRPAPLPVQTAKLLECYAYQASEHGGWAASEARGVVEDLRAALLRGLPGYAEAPWCLG